MSSLPPTEPPPGLEREETPEQKAARFTNFRAGDHPFTLRIVVGAETPEEAARVAISLLSKSLLALWGYTIEHEHPNARGLIEFRPKGRVWMQGAQVARKAMLALLGRG